jgi:hypothetical protein
MTSGDLSSAKAAFSAVLASGAPAAALEQVVVEHFPSLLGFRENDDLVLVESDTRRLLVRRVGHDRFVVGDVAAASGSTNLLDAGGEAERDLDGLIEAIEAFAAI